MYGLPAYLIRCLQSVQNAAAQLIFRIRRSEDISPALVSLHLLRVPECISFKFADIPIHPWHSTATQIPAVLLYPCHRHDIWTTIAVIFLPSLGHAAHLSRQAGVLCFRHYSMERSFASRHMSTITCDFQTAPQVVLVLSVLFGHSHLTRRAFVFVDLAVIDIILATLKIMMTMMMMSHGFSC